MFLATMIGKILERSPLGWSILQYMSLFNPQELARINPSAFAQGKIRKLLHHLINLKLISATTADKVVTSIYISKQRYERKF